MPACLPSERLYSGVHRLQLSNNRVARAHRGWAAAISLCSTSPLFEDTLAFHPVHPPPRPPARARASATSSAARLHLSARRIRRCSPVAPARASLRGIQSVPTRSGAHLCLTSDTKTTFCPPPLAPVASTPPAK